MNVQQFALLAAFGILVLVIELIRRQTMTFRYAFFWLSSSLFVMFLAFKPEIIFHLSQMMGFQLPSNFIFFLLLCFFVCLSLSLTVYINEQNSRTETLAQHIAFLEYKIQSLEENSKNIKK